MFKSFTAGRYFCKFCNKLGMFSNIYVAEVMEWPFTKAVYLISEIV